MECRTDKLDFAFVPIKYPTAKDAGLPCLNLPKRLIHNNLGYAETSYKSDRALTHCQAALSQELGIPLVKDCEELLAKIQATLK
ncbi:MAG: hypothetical protein ACKO5Q_20000 [Microcystaceae cyanobacterium]